MPRADWHTPRRLYHSGLCPWVPCLPGTKERRIEVTAFELATSGFCDFVSPFISGIINVYQKRERIVQTYPLLSYLVISAAVIPGE